MLTKSDVNQIREVVHEEVSTVVDAVIENKLQPIKKDIGSLSEDLKYVKNDLKYVKKDFGYLSKDLKHVRKEVKYIRQTVDIIAKNYDEEDIKLKKRVKRIEDHLALPD